MLPCHCSGTLIKNLDNETIKVNTNNVGLHKTRNFCKLYDLEIGDRIEEQTYYNGCACNEYEGIMKRHITPRIPTFTPGNPSMQMLRENLLKFGSIVRSKCLDWGKSSHERVIDNTTQSKKSRYRKAFSNILFRNLFLDTKHSELKSFVKFEPFAKNKLLEKPPRLIQYRSFEFTYSMKSYLHNFGLALKDPFLDIRMINDQPARECFTKYLKDDEQIEVLLKAWNAFIDPVAVLIDMKSFDGHYDYELLKIENEFWDSIFRSSFLKYLLKQTLKNTAVTMNRIVYKFRGKRCSGEYSTSDGNSNVNWNMLKLWTGTIKCYIFVNGDDSIIIMDRSSLGDLPPKEFFNNFNMEATVEIVDNFENIEYCQRQPVKIGGKFKWVRKPFRFLTRFTVTDSKYIHCPERYCLGKALCELHQCSGVPILQAFCLKIIADSVDRKPLGSVDKVPANNAYSSIQPIVIREISLEDRQNFERSFGISVSEQLEIENGLDAGINIIDPTIIKFLERYKFFVYN